MKQVLVVLIVCLSGIAGAQKAQIDDGTWWSGLSYQQLFYVIGVSQGRCAGAYEALRRVQPRPKLSKPPECNRAGEATYGQITDAVSQFYSDARNRLILATDAFRFVEREIDGNPLSHTELEAMRRNAASPK
jgi:hypothetical protein